MQYILAFLEGIITFISPCLLPMLPIYVSYFAGQELELESKRHKPVKNALGFVLGFTIVFVSLGAFASTLGGLITEYATAVNLVGGIVIILFGVNFLGIVKIPLLNRTKLMNVKKSNMGFGTAMVFGVVFSVGWTPCVGAFLGTALVMAASAGESLTGVIMLLLFSAGLGIPFIISAVLIDKLSATFDFIKSHYRIINIISGCFLILVGILMATGFMGYLLSLLTF